MAKGIALCIGVNRVDPKHYQGWDGPLRGCENDAKDMLAIALSKGFEEKASGTLLTSDATRKKVIDGIKKAAKNLKEGDIFMISYSGHGGQIPDLDDEEADCLDETWCLYDGELLDDELYTLWQSFKEGVRILLFTDSCHSGTVVRGLTQGDNFSSQRSMPFDVAPVVYSKNKTFYDDILKAHPKNKRMDVTIKATALLISGCQDNQTSADGFFNGLFTGKLKSVWSNGKFTGDYRKFHGQIVKKMPRDQTPNYVVLGKPNEVFERQTPFTV